MGGWLSWIYHSQSNTACCITNKVVIFYVVVVVSRYMYLVYVSTISDIFTSSQESQGSDPHMYLL